MVCERGCIIVVNLFILFRHNKTVAQVMIRWSVQMGFITIPKTAKTERIDENANIFDFALDDQDLAAIVSCFWWWLFIWAFVYVMFWAAMKVTMYILKLLFLASCAVNVLRGYLTCLWIVLHSNFLYFLFSTEFPAWVFLHVDTPTGPLAWMNHTCHIIKWCASFACTGFLVLFCSVMFVSFLVRCNMVFLSTLSYYFCSLGAIETLLPIIK